MFSFNFKNEDSRDYGINVESIPIIPTWEPNDNLIIIKFAIKNKDYITQLFDLKKWLKGNGKLIMSHMPDYFINIDNCILREISKNNTFIVLEVTMTAYPGVYYLDGERVIEISTINQVIFNPGITNSNPFIKIYSDDMVMLDINGNLYQVNRINGYVILDCDLLDAYDDFGFKNDDIDGGFPQFIPGENLITIRGGTFSKIELIPRWRCI